MLVEIHGIHPVAAPESVHLIEIQIHDFTGTVDLGQITQTVSSIPYIGNQVPWLPHKLSTDGLSGEELSEIEPVEVESNCRLAFFLHFLNTSMPLETQFGPTPLPVETMLPNRLSFIKFRPVD